MAQLREYDPVAGATREPVDVAPQVVLDERRRRPFFFDGRFLTARDLTTEQNYRLLRQADLGQVGGGGVISGLEVSEIRRDRRSSALDVEISAGSGITPAGELVSLCEAVRLRVSNVPVGEELNATVNLRRPPSDPVANRTGIYALALRPVEFADHPEVAYATGLLDQRRIEEGEIVEAAAFALLPIRETSRRDVWRIGRARIAYDFFVKDAARRLSLEALPIALLAISRGRVLWTDNFLIRREIGTGSALGFGIGDRSRSAAYAQQYAAHLADVEASRADAGVTPEISARRHFRSLPPFGPLPRGAVVLSNGVLAQSYFPPDYNVELTLLPEPELTSLAHDALSLPPIDLSAPPESRQATPILIGIPLPPSAFSERVAELQGQGPTPPTPASRRPTKELLPLEALNALARRSRPDVPAPEPAVNLAPWQAAIEQAPRLYYVRRRQLSPVSFLVPRYAGVGAEDPSLGPEWAQARAVLLAADEIGLTNDTGEAILSRLDFLLRRAVDTGQAAETAVVDAVRELFESPAFSLGTLDPAPIRLLVKGAAAELCYRIRVAADELARPSPGLQAPLAPHLSGLDAGVRVRPLRVPDVEAVRQRYQNHDANNALGSGYQQLIAEVERLGEPDVVDFVAQSLCVPELDFAVLRSGRFLAARIASALDAYATLGDMTGVRQLSRGVVPDDPPEIPGRDVRVGAPATRRPQPVPRDAGSFAAIAVDEGHYYHYVVSSSLRDSVRDAAIALLEQPGFAQPLIVSALLSELLVLAWPLDLGEGEPERVQQVLDAIDQVDDRLFVGGRLVVPEFSDVSALEARVARFQDIAGQPGHGLLTGRLTSLKFGTDLNDHRVIGLATHPGENESLSVRLVERLMGSTDEQLRELVPALRLAARSRRLSRIRQLVGGTL